MSDFEPTSYGLSDTFRLTSYGDLKESKGCKVPERVVSELLDTFAADSSTTSGGQQQKSKLEQMLLQMNINPRSPGEGVQHHLTIECRYPIIDDPYTMGKIICAEAVGDLYAMGITECEQLMMLVCWPPRMTADEFNLVFELMEQGFKDCFRTTGPMVIWAQYAHHRNWFIAGGLASAYWSKRHLLERGNAVDGDVLVLTKPLGTQVAIDAYGCIGQPDRWERYKNVVSENDVDIAYQQAVRLMCHLNRKAARLMHLHNAHGAIAVSGRGLLAHAKTLALLQKQSVSFVIDTLPVIANMAAVAKAVDGADNCPLLQGRSAETSGGLLICMSYEEAVFYCKFIKAEDDHLAWIIGTVQSGPREATIIDNVTIIEVPDRT
ncbi:inactive selenide, water dikinase-like protein [Drosophila obscura]|uniref:inactive selenide, water dikinase-like protein n=1 Tax=Drosophila obscura TaxID=7282 RepID=UPI001BB23225|nr:inactive selenide, water dikinase-like protein [Drosophila obscura]